MADWLVEIFNKVLCCLNGLETKISRGTKIKETEGVDELEQICLFLT